MNKLMNDKRGVFGLTAVQSFFGIILGIALLAYVIVIIMGTLGEADILDPARGSVDNETGFYMNGTTYTVDQASVSGFGSFTVTQVFDSVLNVTLLSGNYTVGSAGTIVNATADANSTNEHYVSYTYTYDSTAKNNLDYILTNTSTGVTGFFSSISPIYAILAILVIILVLTVLVRVVQGNRSSMGEPPQL